MGLYNPLGLDLLNLEERGQEYFPQPGDHLEKHKPL